jgi:hypothetical protein
LPAAAAVAAKASESADRLLKSVIDFPIPTDPDARRGGDRTMETWPEPGVDTGVKLGEGERKKIPGGCRSADARFVLGIETSNLETNQ